MGRVSKRVISEDVQNELEDQLSFIIASMVDKKEIAMFLSEFLTKEEKVMLGKRLVLYMMIHKGIPSEKIHNVLCLSYDTVRWYSNLYTTKPEAFRKLIAKLIKREKGKDLWKKIDKLMAPLELALNAKSNMKARAKFMNGEWYED